ncbi:MAG: hypothetical protein U0W40_03355 [Acidimicrobiia bacterium]
MLPDDRRAVDGWIGFPTTEPIRMLDPLRAQFKGAESRAEDESLVGFLFGAGVHHDDIDPDRDHARTDGHARHRGWPRAAHHRRSRRGA